MWRLVALAALVGCHAEVGSAFDTAPDASTSGTGGSGGGSGSGSGSDAGGTGLAACPNGRVVYLSFEGETLTQAAASDATTNHASWIGVATATVPRYRSNDNNRNGEISNIVDGVRARLAATPIAVVTTRPAHGPYVMIVFGGQKQAVGTVYNYATNEHDCGDVVKSDLGWISDQPSVSYAQDLALGTIGWGLGLNGTNDPGGCMCGWANNCSSASGACTLASSIPTLPSSSPATTCPNMDPQDEVTAFSTAFCQ